jgi:hypothetical protein
MDDLGRLVALAGAAPCLIPEKVGPMVFCFAGACVEGGRLCPCDVSRVTDAGGNRGPAVETGENLVNMRYSGGGVSSGQGLDAEDDDGSVLARGSGSAGALRLMLEARLGEILGACRVPEVTVAFMIMRTCMGLAEVVFTKVPLRRRAVP